MMSDNKTFLLVIHHGKGSKVKDKMYRNRANSKGKGCWDESPQDKEGMAQDGQQEGALGRKGRRGRTDWAKMSGMMRG